MEFLDKKILKKIDTTTWAPCWIWIGAKDKNGTPRQNKNVWGTAFPRQFIFQASGKEVREGKDLLSVCERIDCVNPEHLTYELPLHILYQQFMRQVEKTDGCWLWTGCKDTNGYGRLNKEKFGESIAHRFSYKFNNPGVELPPGLRHSQGCQKNCVNPIHLKGGVEGESWNRSNNYDTIAEGKLHNQRIKDKAHALAIRQRILDGARTKDLVTELRCSKVCIADLKKGRTWNEPECFPTGWT
jgi:hypothetical protein